MIYLQKSSIRFICLVAISLFFLSCDKEIDEKGGIPSLSIVESTIPVEELSVDGGSVTLEVKWAHKKWNVTADEVIEGEEFITNIAPTYAGSVEQGETQTKVKITYKSNDRYTQNRQKLVVRSLTEDLYDSIIITQAAKPVEPVNITVDPETTYQTVSGFGGGNMMWGTDYLTASQIKSAFGMGENELGFTILRVRLSPNPSDWSLLVETLKEAKKYDAKIIASPWSSPASLKSNNDLVGGYLLEENYAAYADHLNDFVQFMALEGVTIDAVSIQNEPDIQVGYESCDWTSDQIFNFIKDHASAIQGTKVAAAESFNFKQSYTNKILNDPVAVNNLGLVAGHIYGGGLAAYPLAGQKGKEIWMTEYLMNQNSGADPNNWDQSEAAIWNETMQMLETIHDAMNYNWNAYIWWYIRRYYSFLGDGEHGTTRGEVLKRGLAMSHYSKFIRPGYERIDFQTDASTGELKVTTYKGDSKIVAVIINPENYPIHGLSFSIPQTITSAVAYTTSEFDDRTMETLTPDDKNVTVNTKAKSITTLVMSF